MFRYVTYHGWVLFIFSSRGLHTCVVLVSGVQTCALPICCVVVMSVRDGVNLAHRRHFPKHPAHASAEELLESFISKHYLEQPAPPEILVSHAVNEDELLQEALGQRAGRKVSIAQPQRDRKSTRLNSSH